MKKYRILLAFILAAGGAAIAGFGLRSAKNRVAAGSSVVSPEVFLPPASGPGFAVVELFTSEGCSSCPPADAVLAKIAAEYKENVYVLGFHVDYWDRQGWKDIYSNADYTQRQMGYARVFKLSSIYTPEAVVNGGKELVGSDEKGLLTDIEADLQGAEGKKIVLQAAGDGTSAAGNGNNIKVNYQAPNRGSDILYIALVQSHAETKVGGGENSGRRLEHVNVVRELKAAPAGNTGSLVFALPQGLSAKDCKLIAFLQTNKAGSLAVTGAASISIP